MFVVLNVINGICYFEVPGIDKYSHVALVDIQEVKPVTSLTVQDDEDKIDDDEDTHVSLVDIQEVEPATTLSAQVDEDEIDDEEE